MGEMKAGLTAPSKRIEVPIFYHKSSVQIMTEPATIALLSDRFDFVQGFREFGQVTGERQAGSAYPLWCDEIAVSVHLNNETDTIMPAGDGNRVGSLTVLPTFTTTTLRMEAQSNLASNNYNPFFIVASEPENITDVLNSGYGVSRVYTPAPRIVRMAVRGSWADASAASLGLIMDVTCRCRNLYPLMAMLEREWGGVKPHLIERPLGDGSNGIIRSLVPAC